MVRKRAGCEHVRFHDLCHTFATDALEDGMDNKALSAVIGHVFSATTLDVYASTEEECERKLVELIMEMKKELEPLRARKKAG